MGHQQHDPLHLAVEVAVPLAGAGEPRARGVEDGREVAREGLRVPEMVIDPRPDFLGGLHAGGERRRREDRGQERGRERARHRRAAAAAALTCQKTMYICASGMPASAGTPYTET